jgi:hypothetical protein
VVLVPVLLLVASGTIAWATAPAPDQGPVLEAKHYVPAANPWTTLAASGTVEARAPGMPDTDWARVRRGDEMQPYTTVRTGKRSRATLSRKADVLLVDPKSEVELPGKRIGRSGTTVRQTRGSVVYEVDGSESRDFKVVTPYLVAGVKGTVFRVTVTDRYASVTVDEGTVEVASRRDDEMFVVRAGETVLMDAEEGSSLELIAPDRADASRSSREAQRVARNESARLEQTVQRFEQELGKYFEDPDTGFDESDDEASLSLRLEEENELKPEAGEEDDSLSEDLLDEELRQGDPDEFDPNEDPDSGIEPDESLGDPDPFIDPQERPPTDRRRRERVELARST